MHLLLELLTVAFTALSGLHAWGRRGTEGLWLFASLLVLGAVRESFVAFRDLLYGFAPLHLEVFGTPLIAAVVWAFSIYVALVWSEEVAGPAGRGETSTVTLALVAVLMVALACFYEPFLALTGMARWEAGTRSSGGVPWIALIGYPTLGVAFLVVYGALTRALRHPLARGLALGVAVPALGLAHAWGLQVLKRLLGW